MPALLTRMSTGPRSRSVWATISAISTGLDMSAALCATGTRCSRDRSAITPAVARERAHHLLGLRDPGLGHAHPPHPSALTQLVQVLRCVHGSSFLHERATPPACAPRSFPPRPSG